MRSNRIAPAPATEIAESKTDDNREAATNYVKGVIDTAEKDIEEKSDLNAEEKLTTANPATVQPQAKSEEKSVAASASAANPAPVQAEAKTQEISSADIIEAQKIVSKMDPIALASLINAASVASAAPKEMGGKKTRRRRKNKSKSAKRRR
jgi:hypothetical protein